MKLRWIVVIGLCYGLLASVLMLGMQRAFRTEQPPAPSVPVMPVTTAWVVETNGALLVFTETVQGPNKIYFVTNLLSYDGAYRSRESRVHDKAYEFLTYARSLGCSNIGLQFTISARTNVYPAR